MDMGGICGGGLHKIINVYGFRYVYPDGSGFRLCVGHCAVCLASASRGGGWLSTGEQPEGAGPPRIAMQAGYGDGQGVDRCEVHGLSW